MILITEIIIMTNLIYYHIKSINKVLSYAICISIAIENKHLIYLFIFNN